MPIKLSKIDNNHQALANEVVATAAEAGAKLATVAAVKGFGMLAGVTSLASGLLKL